MIFPISQPVIDGPDENRRLLCRAAALLCRVVAVAIEVCAGALPRTDRRPRPGNADPHGRYQRRNVARSSHRAIPRCLRGRYSFRTPGAALLHSCTALMIHMFSSATARKYIKQCCGAIVFSSVSTNMNIHGLYPANEARQCDHFELPIPKRPRRSAILYVLYQLL